MTHHLMGAVEVAKFLGVSRQRVHQLAARPDFPRPAAELTAGKVWESTAIEAWHAAQRRAD
jgi:prophage regulatory protein